jgi:DnaJ-class molecular chaperone
VQGGTVTVTHLDGRVISIPLAAPAHTGSSVVLLGEGMPLPRQPSRRGNLHVTIQVC